MSSHNLTFKKNVATITEVNVMQNMYQEKLTHFQSLGSSHLIASPKSLEKKVESIVLPQTAENESVPHALGDHT